jgi:hypothetical protein
LVGAVISVPVRIVFLRPAGIDAAISSHNFCSVLLRERRHSPKPSRAIHRAAPRFASAVLIASPPFAEPISSGTISTQVYRPVDDAHAGSLVLIAQRRDGLSTWNGIAGFFDLGRDPIKKRPSPVAD